MVVFLVFINLKKLKFKR